MTLRDSKVVVRNVSKSDGTLAAQAAFYVTRMSHAPARKPSADLRRWLWITSLLMGVSHDVGAELVAPPSDSVQRLWMKRCIPITQNH